MCKCTIHFVITVTLDLTQNCWNNQENSWIFLRKQKISGTYSTMVCPLAQFSDQWRKSPNSTHSTPRCCLLIPSSVLHLFTTCGIVCTMPDDLAVYSSWGSPRRSQYLLFIPRSLVTVLLTVLYTWREHHSMNKHKIISSKYSRSNEEVFGAKRISYSELKILHHKFMLHGLWYNVLMSNGC